MKDIQGTQWSPKRPLGKENGDSKLIYALLFYLDHFLVKTLGEQKPIPF